MTRALLSSGRRWRLALAGRRRLGTPHLAARGVARQPARGDASSPASAGRGAAVRRLRRSTPRGCLPDRLDVVFYAKPRPVRVQVARAHRTASRSPSGGRPTSRSCSPPSTATATASLNRYELEHIFPVDGMRQMLPGRLLLPRPPAARRRSTQIDRDADGRVSFAEFAQLLPRDRRPTWSGPGRCPPRPAATDAVTAGTVHPARPEQRRQARRGRAAGRREDPARPRRRRGRVRLAPGAARRTRRGHALDPAQTAVGGGGPADDPGGPSSRGPAQELAVYHDRRPRDRRAAGHQAVRHERRLRADPRRDRLRRRAVRPARPERRRQARRRPSSTAGGPARRTRSSAGAGRDPGGVQGDASPPAGPAWPAGMERPPGDARPARAAGRHAVDRVRPPPPRRRASAGSSSAAVGAAFPQGKAVVTDEGPGRPAEPVPAGDLRRRRLRRRRQADPGRVRRSTSHLQRAPPTSALALTHAVRTPNLFQMLDDNVDGKLGRAGAADRVGPADRAGADRGGRGDEGDPPAVRSTLRLARAAYAAYDPTTSGRAARPGSRSDGAAVVPQDGPQRRRRRVAGRVPGDEADFASSTPTPTPDLDGGGRGVRQEGRREGCEKPKR